MAVPMNDYTKCPLCGLGARFADYRRADGVYARIRYKCDAVYDLTYLGGGEVEGTQIVRCTRDPTACLGEGI